MTKFSLPLLLDTNVSVYSSQVIRQWPCPSPPYLSLTPRRNDIPFLASSHIFLHVIPRESSASTFPCYVRISAYICTTGNGKASAGFSKKNIDSRYIELDVRTHLYRRYPSPFSRSLSFFFFFFAFPLVIGRERETFLLLPPSPPPPVRNTFPQPHELPVNPLRTNERERCIPFLKYREREKEKESPSSILDFGCWNRRND